MSDDTPSPLNNVITIDDERIRSHLERVVRGTVEETLNALLDAEADRLCNAQRYERSASRSTSSSPPRSRPPTRSPAPAPPRARSPRSAAWTRCASALPPCAPPRPQSAPR